VKLHLGANTKSTTLRISIQKHEEEKCDNKRKEKDEKNRNTEDEEDKNKTKSNMKSCMRKLLCSKALYIVPSVLSVLYAYAQQR
jgi:GTP-dependent phosphoenolpyruvate carboxykinase